MSTTQRKAQTQRDDRSGEGRRRRRKDGIYAHGNRLGVNPDLCDFNNFRYRFINDDPGRIVAKTVHDDWDMVPNIGGEVKEDSSDLGNMVSIIVGAHADGSPKRAYLCRKKKKFYEEDQSERQAELDQQLAELMRGNTRHGKPQADYVPNAGISM